MAPDRPRGRQGEPGPRTCHHLQHRLLREERGRHRKGHQLVDREGALNVSSNGEPVAGPSWPDGNIEPTPLPEYRSRERDEDRPTRKPSGSWDRIKVLVLLLGL